MFGCRFGNGRYTYAIQNLGADKVTSFDISSEGVSKCRQINPDAYVFNLMDLVPNPIYDFVLCWGVLNHVEDPRKAFNIVASQVKNDGKLHIMVYHEKTQKPYEEGRRIWSTLSMEEKLKYCQEKVKNFGGTLHGWFDAFNPKYNWSFNEKQIKNWFEKEGFKKIKLVTKYNINMQGSMAK